MKKSYISILLLTMTCGVSIGILNAGCTKLRETTTITDNKFVNEVISDSMTIYLYDSLGREFEFVKYFTRKVTPADTALFNEEAYREFYKNKKSWYSWY